MTGQYQAGKGFVPSSRQAIAQALMAQGASTTPVRSPLEGIARALTGALGGHFASSAREDQQKALKAAMAALQDPSIPVDQRMSRAVEAAGTDSPIADQLMTAQLSRMMPKDPVALPKSSRLVDPRTGAITVDAAADLPQGMRLNSTTGQVEEIPGFGPVAGGIKKAESGGTAQGAADVKLAMEPQIIDATAGPQARAGALAESAKNPALIARTGGQAQATANVDLRMKPQIGAATIAAETPGMVDRAGRVSAATAAGTNTGQLQMVDTPTGRVPGVQAVAQAREQGERAGKGGAPLNDSERKWREEFKKPIDQASDLVNQRNIIKTSLAQANGTGDIAAIVGFNKMLDPGAVVREADVQLTLAAQGLADRLAVWMNNKQEGDILPPALRQKMGELSDAIFKTSSDTLKSRILPYQPVIEGEGARFGNVIPMELQTTLGWAAAPAAAKPADSPQGLPRFSDDPASRAAYGKLPSGSAYHDEKGQLRFKP